MLSNKKVVVETGADIPVPGLLFELLVSSILIISSSTSHISTGGDTVISASVVLVLVSVSVPEPLSVPALVLVLILALVLV